jgi:transposase
MRDISASQGNHLSLQDKGVIVGMHQLRTPETDIAEVVGCHRETVRRWIQRYEETLDVTRRLGSGRPGKTSPLDDARLFAAVRAKPITSLQELKGSKIVLYKKSILVLL